MRPRRPLHKRRSKEAKLGSKLSSYTYRSNPNDEVAKQSHHTEVADMHRSPQASSANHVWLQRFGLMVLLVVIIVFAVRLLSLSDTVKVIPLNSNGSSKVVSSSLAHNLQVYEQAADKIMSRSIWNQNKITVNTVGLGRGLQTQFPELTNVSITVPLLAHQLLVYVEPTQLALVLQLDNGQSFAVNENGKAIIAEPSSQLIQELSLPTVIDHANLSIQSAAAQALPMSDVTFIQTVVTELDAKQYKISSLTMPAGNNELDVGIGGEPYIIKFNFQNNDPRQQVGTFLATIALLHSQNITPAHYVDVRVDGRSYYQ